MTQTLSHKSTKQMDLNKTNYRRFYSNFLFSQEMFILNIHIYNSLSIKKLKQDTICLKNDIYFETV